MRQIAQSYRTGKLSLVDVAPPRAPHGGVLVETKASLISAGTERTIVELAKKNLLAKAKERPDLVAKVIDKVKREGVLSAFDAVRSKLDSPIPLGYSMAGHVLQVGSGTRDFACGDRVACAGAGFANHSELNAVPVNLATHIPDNVTDEEASFVTVGAIALHGIRLVRPTLGETVAVIGLGLIGQIAVSLLLAHGCEVVAIDVDRSKVELAIKRGATVGCVSGQDDCIEIVRGITKGNGVDSVVITASAPNNQPLVLSGDIARDRAMISVVGLMPLEIPRAAYYMKELNVIVSRSYGPGRYDIDYEERGRDYPIGFVRWTEKRNLDAVLSAIAKGRLDVKSLITHRFDFDRALDAYALITGEVKEPHLGVVLTYASNQKSASNQSVPSDFVSRKRDSVRFGIVGTGAFATSVLLPKLKDVSGAEMVVAASGKGLSAQHAMHRFEMKRVASGLDEVLASNDVDAVLIATRHHLHAEQATKAIAAGKDVFLEKPAAINEEQLQSLHDAVSKSQQRLMVGFNRRFSPFAKTVKDEFAYRQTGLVMIARINAGRLAAGTWINESTEGGGRIVGEGCHFIDLMSYWAEALPTRVSTHAIGINGGGYGRDENVSISISFADGSVGTLIYTSMGDASVGKEYYEIFCGGKIVTIDDFRELKITQQGKTRTTRALRQDKGHGEELQAFVDACRYNRPSPISWESIRATTLATIAAEQSWVNGASVELFEPAVSAR